MNIFTLVCCEVGGGKSPAFSIGCGEPLQSHVQANKDTQILLDDFTYCSLYESLLKTNGNKVVIGKEEAGGWLGRLFETDKMQVSE